MNMPWVTSQTPTHPGTERTAMNKYKFLFSDIATRLIIEAGAQAKIFSMDEQAMTNELAKILKKLDFSKTDWYRYMAKKAVEELESGAITKEQFDTAQKVITEFANWPVETPYKPDPGTDVEESAPPPAEIAAAENELSFLNERMAKEKKNLKKQLKTLDDELAKFPAESMPGVEELVAQIEQSEKPDWTPFWDKYEEYIAKVAPNIQAEGDRLRAEYRALWDRKKELEQIVYWDKWDKQLAAQPPEEPEW